MNSGDVFVESSSLSLAMQNRTDGVNVIFADWIYANSGKTINASKKKMTIRHRSIIYKEKYYTILMEQMSMLLMLQFQTIYIFYPLRELIGVTIILRCQYAIIWGSLLNSLIFTKKLL